MKKFPKELAKLALVEDEKGRKIEKMRRRELQD